MSNHAGKYAKEYEDRSSKVLSNLVESEGNIRHAWLGPILSDAYKRASQSVITTMFNAEVDAPPTFVMLKNAVDSLSDDQKRMYGSRVEHILENDWVNIRPANP